ncbi:MAG: hypothetical protein RRC34_09960 [Lentisphaeria bacterium]|nr:hypothetical protein [Lentisphaeria bacterium]
MHVALAAFLAVQADDHEIRDNHPAAVVEFTQIAEGLIHGGDVAVAALFGIQIGAGGFQFDHGTGEIRVRTIISETGIRGSATACFPGGRFHFDGMGIQIAGRQFVSQQPGKKIDEKLSLGGTFGFLQKKRIPAGLGPPLDNRPFMRSHRQFKPRTARSQKVGIEKIFSGYCH